MYKKLKIDYILLLYIFIFFIMSLLSIKSASMYLSPSLGNLVLKQCLWYLIGIFIIILIFKFKIETLLKYSPYLYIFNCILLLGLLFFAPEINGSKCWYIIKGIGSFQPSEFMKITLLLMEIYIINNYFKKYENPSIKDEFTLLIKIFIVFLIPTIITFLEPDTGVILIYFITTIIVLFVSKIRLRWFIILLVIISLVAGIFFYFYFYKQDLFIKVFGSNFFYRIDRIINWKTGSGMQLENSLIAIGSSNILGHGFNKTPLYFPEAGTDFIFSVYASNFGFIGSLLMIIVLLLFDIHLLNNALKSKMKENKLIIIGIFSIFIYQQIQNISMTLGILPITGITLPFISYGGSSLISYMICVGLILNIYNKEKSS